MEVMKVIELSYNNLSDHLKLCFLYLASYRKDEEIRVNDLKDLWSAEGFVEQSEMKSVEDVIEDYLDHLVSSSLVKVSEGIFDKVCKIHDLAHDFCLIKSRKEKLFDYMSLSTPSSPCLMSRQLTIRYDGPVSPYHHNNVLLGSSCKHLLSLRITGGWYGSFPSRVCQLRQLRLLRVLDFNIITIKSNSWLKEISMLLHLRFFNIRTRHIEALPRLFSHLWNLETLLLYHYSRRPMVVEPTLWKLKRLRRVEITPVFSFSFGADEATLLSEDSRMENLRILGKIQFSCSKDPVDIFNRFPNIRKLYCNMVDLWDTSTGCNWFPQFSLLNELEELSVYGTDYARLDERNTNNTLSFEAKHSGDFPFFPWSLRSLSLGEGFLTCGSLSTIAKLPNLEKLHLSFLTIVGNEWNMEDDDTFESLKVLQLFEVRLSEWQVREESFPVLEHLILEYCGYLKEIPLGFGDINSLKSIDLRRSPELGESALKIKKDVEEMTGDDKLQLLLPFKTE